MSRRRDGPPRYSEDDPHPRSNPNPNLNIPSSRTSRPRASSFSSSTYKESVAIGEGGRLINNVGVEYTDFQVDWDTFRNADGTYDDDGRRLMSVVPYRGLENSSRSDASSDRNEHHLDDRGRTSSRLEDFNTTVRNSVPVMREHTRVNSSYDPIYDNQPCIPINGNRYNHRDLSPPHLRNVYSNTNPGCSSRGLGPSNPRIDHSNVSPTYQGGYQSYRPSNMNYQAPSNSGFTPPTPFITPYVPRSQRARNGPRTHLCDDTDDDHRENRDRDRQNREERDCHTSALVSSSHRNRLNQEAATHFLANTRDRHDLDQEYEDLVRRHDALSLSPDRDRDRDRPGRERSRSSSTNSRERRRKRRERTRRIEEESQQIREKVCRELDEEQRISLTPLLGRHKSRLDNDYEQRGSPIINVTGNVSIYLNK